MAWRSEKGETALPNAHRPIAVSIGVAGYRPGLEKADAMIRATDAALYEAKHRGRNLVVRAGELRVGTGHG